MKPVVAEAREASRASLPSPMPRPKITLVPEMAAQIAQLRSETFLEFAVANLILVVLPTSCTFRVNTVKMPTPSTKS